jgi:integrase/recombinase XerD
MKTEVVVHQQVRTWLERSVLQPYLSELHSHFQRGRYAESTQHIYLYCIAHFASWITRRRLEVARLDERVIARFVAEHLPHCDCLDPVRRSRGETRTALRHLMQTLRACGAMPANSGNADSLQVELSCFDHYMDQVRGLAPNTRRQRLRIVQRFLVERFASRPIVFTSIRPADVRGFVLGHHAAYSTGTMQVIGGAIRCYLRYRSIAGDPAQRLLSAVPSVANWRLATLPQVLSEREVQQLLESVKRLPSSAKRAYAMVRCLTDLGLRASEVVQLQLCDIDWHVGTIRLTANKSRRVDILPLPVETGRAIAEYLRSERPQTTDRAVCSTRCTFCQTDPGGCCPKGCQARLSEMRLGLFASSHSPP